MFHVYYYSRKLEGDRKLKPLSESLGTSASDEGVVSTNCSEELLDKFGNTYFARIYVRFFLSLSMVLSFPGEHIGIARWLYSSALTPPHNHNDWRCW